MSAPAGIRPSFPLMNIPMPQSLGIWPNSRGDAEGEAELHEQVPEVETAGVYAVADGAPLPAEVLELGARFPGDEAADHVERGLHLDSGPAR